MCFLSKVLMSLTILIRFRVVIFVVTIIASTFTTRLDFTVHVLAIIVTTKITTLNRMSIVKDIKTFERKHIS